MNCQRFNEEKGTVEINNELKKLIVGQSITEIIEDKEHGEFLTLILSNGVEINVLSNEGCGGCNNGWFTYNDVITTGVKGNVITNVTVDCDYGNDGGDSGTFTFNVYSLNKRILSADFAGYDSGFYGIGITMTATVGSLLKPEEERYWGVLADYFYELQEKEQQLTEV
jgi:hypothetical protein